jgi:hypothetical protein
MILSLLFWRSCFSFTEFLQRFGSGDLAMFPGWSGKRETDRFVAEGCGRSRRPTENNGGIAKCGLSYWIHQLQTEATAQKILLPS